MSMWRKSFHQEGTGVTFISLCGEEGKIWIPTISIAVFLFPYASLYDNSTFKISNVPAARLFGKTTVSIVLPCPAELYPN